MGTCIFKTEGAPQKATFDETAKRTRKRQFGAPRVDSKSDKLRQKDAILNIARLYHFKPPPSDPNLRGRFLGSPPAYLGLVSSKLRAPHKKRLSTKRQSGLENDKLLERPEWIQKATKRRHVEYRSIGGAQSGFNSSSQYQTTCRVDKTNHPVERLSLNRSQCGSCSTKYDTSAGT